MARQFVATCPTGSTRREQEVQGTHMEKYVFSKLRLNSTKELNFPTIMHGVFIAIKISAKKIEAHQK